MRQRGGGVLRSSPWIAPAVLAATLVAIAAAGRSEGPGVSAAPDDAANPVVAYRSTAGVVAENATIAETVVVTTVETTTVGESLPAAPDSRLSDPRSVNDRPADPRTQAISTVAGVRAFVDPETGELTANPTRAQLQRQVVERRASALSRSTAGLKPFELSRGGRGLNLQGRFQTAMRVERGADGSLHVTCGAGHEDGHAHDHATSTVAPPVQ